MKTEHAAWLASDEPNVKRLFKFELRTLVLALAVLQVIADTFQVLGLSI